MAAFSIRTYGDPVLKQRSNEVAEFDAGLRRLASGMLETMYEAEGLGLAAPQVGVQKRLFVYDLPESEQGPRVIVNPEIVEARGEWARVEGCLSVPGLSWEIVRPKEVYLRGRSVDGEEVTIEADELLARMFQHELDHLDGILLIERLDPDQRRQALGVLRAMTLPGLDADRT